MCVDEVLSGLMADAEVSFVRVATRTEAQIKPGLGCLLFAWQVRVPRPRAEESFGHRATITRKILDVYKQTVKRAIGDYARTTSAFSTQPSAPPPSPRFAPGAIFTSPNPKDSRAT